MEGSRSRAVATTLTAAVALGAAVLPATAEAEVVTTHAVSPHVVTPHVVTPPAPGPPPSASSPSPAPAPSPASPPAATPRSTDSPAAVGGPTGADPTDTEGSSGLIDVSCPRGAQICEEERIYAEELKHAREFGEWVEELHQIEIEKIKAERRLIHLEEEQAKLPPWNPVGRLLCPLYIELGKMAQDRLEQAIADRGAVFDDESEFQEAVEMTTMLSRLNCVTKVIP